MADWQHGLFGCFDNCGICIITYFVPCFTAGKNAESVGKSCLLYGFLSMLGPCGIYFNARVREEVRQQKGIDGSFGHDCCMSWLCAICSIIQVAQEVQGTGGAQEQSMSRT